MRSFLSRFSLLLLGVFAACAKKEAATSAAPVARHEHPAPHGGTPVVLGKEAYHLEFVLDPSAGKLSAYVFDGEMENFIRIAAPSFEVIATVGGQPQVLLFQAVANPATGEKIGDTALFAASADWLKAAPPFDAVLTKLDLRGTTFAGIAFNYPKGNDRD